MRNFLFGSYKFQSFRVNLFLAFLRIFAGFAMAFGHGMGKIPVSERFIEGVDNLGFPVSFVFAWAAAISEFLGGILLGLGLLTRPAALFLSLTMATAAFLRHADDPFSSKEKSLLYLFIFLLFLVTGSGKIGLDRAIKR